MRIEKITIKNMGPFVNTTIDYTKVGTNGVVLIAGDTGAGKSTVYDAITYALYGKTSGGERDAAMLHNKGRAGHETMYVELKFSEKGKRYRIVRTRVASGTSKLQLFSINAGMEQEISKKQDIGGQDMSVQDIIAKEILHMQYDQFVKCSMLAQGKFREILTDETKRGDILASLFKTDKLGLLVDRIKAEKKTLSDAVDLAKRDLELALKDIAYTSEQTAVYACFSKDNFYADMDGGAKALGEILTKEKQELDKLKQANDKLQSEIEEANGVYEKAVAYAEDKKVLETAQQQLPKVKQAYEQAVAAYNAAEQELKNGTQYAVRVEALKDILAQFQTLPQLERKLSELRQQYEKQQIALATGKKQVEALAAAVKQEEERLAALPNFGQQQAQLEAQQQLLNNVGKLIFESDKCGEQVKKSAAALQKQTASLHIAEQVYAEAEQEKVRVKTAWDESKELEQQKAALTEAKHPLEDMTILLQQRKEKLHNLELCQKAYVKDSKEYTEAKTAYDVAYKDFLDNQAGVLAQQLDELGYCPVCGAKHEHFGQRAEQHAGVKSEAEIKKLQEKAAKANDKQIASASRITGMQENIQELEQTLKEKAATVTLGEWTSYDALAVLVGEELKLQENALLKLAHGIAELKNIYKDKNNVAACEQKHAKQQELKEQTYKDFNQAEADYKTASAMLATKRKEELQAFITQGYVADDAALQSALSLYGTDGFTQEAQEQIAAAVRQGRNRLKVAAETITRSLKDVQAAQKQAEKAKRDLEAEKNKLETSRTAAIELGNELVALAGKKDNAQEAYEEKQHALAQYDEQKVAAEKQELEQKLTANVNNHAQAKKQMERQAEVLTGLNSTIEIKSKATAGVTVEAPEVIESRITELKLKRDADAKQYLDRSNNLNTNKLARKKIVRALGDYQTSNDRLSIVKPLAEFISGQENKGNKIDLETFAQGYYLDQVVVAANVILRKLSKHRYYLKRRINKTKDNSKKVTGLQLYVFDSWNNAERDVKSMSGGEGFMASMALALGLAEVTKRQHGATAVESIFIDEGFGTLDAASLEQIMDLLNDLSGSKNAHGEEKTDSEKRMVTIISHLDELGKSVSKQFVISKCPAGSEVKFRDLNLEHY